MNMNTTATTPTIERFAENETADLARQDARLAQKGKSGGNLTAANVTFALRQRGFGDDESIAAATAVIAKARAARPVVKAPRTTATRQYRSAILYGHEGSWCRYCSGPVADGRGDCGECR